MTFTHNFKWDTLVITKIIDEYLEKLNWNVKNSLGFENDGSSAFIITARKQKNTIEIFIENEYKQIVIRGGIDGKYLAKRKQKPQYNRTFKINQLRDASLFLDEILDKLS